QSIPAIIAFKDGQPVDGFMGAVPESQIREFIDRIAKGESPQIEEALAAAAQARETGDTQGAAQIYAAVLQHEPENSDALVALADLFFDAGQVEQAKQFLEQLPEDKKDIPAAAAVRAKMALAEQVAGLGDPAELERRLAENPADHQARFDLALICNARGERADATDHLLSIMKADREWNDDGARKKLLELFESWGMTDRATLAGRRKLSSLLFSWAVRYILQAVQSPCRLNCLTGSYREAWFMTDGSRLSSGLVDPKLLELLVCPITKGPLKWDASRQELISG